MSRQSTGWITVCIAAASIYLSGTAGAHARQLETVSPVIDCKSLVSRVIKVADIQAKISSATRRGHGDSAVCRVVGNVDPAVGFEMRMPLLNWRQRMLHTGCGGFCGTITHDVIGADGCVAVESNEMVLVASNLGHTASNGIDSSWAVGNPQAIVDFGHRGVHVVNVVSREIIRLFYGQAPAYAYFTGCSDGGREGLMTAQRYPQDFDGILVGAPVVNLTANNSIYHAWIVQHLINRDQTRRLSRADLSRINTSVIAQCDSLDGKTDGIIAVPGECQVNLEPLLCHRQEHKNCLSADQLSAVKALYQGPVDPDGRELYHGLPVGSEKLWPGQAYWSARFANSFINHLAGAGDTPPEESVWDVSYDEASVAGYNKTAPLLNALDPDLSAFHQAGGKLILWHGSIDTSVPPRSTERYVAAVKDQMGLSQTDEFLRFYPMPGVEHCRGGEGPDRFDLLSPLMSWVEDALPPGAIPAHHHGLFKRDDWLIAPTN